MPPVNLAFKVQTTTPLDSRSSSTSVVASPLGMGNTVIRTLAVVAAVSYLGFSAVAVASPDGEHQAARAQFWSGSIRPQAVARAYLVERRATTTAASSTPAALWANPRPRVSYQPCLTCLLYTGPPSTAPPWLLRRAALGGHGRLGAG